jgi:ADP-heptose:LPS heptosyltransferase
MDARENILLICLKSIGDILFTLPAIPAVRENFPTDFVSDGVIFFV